MRTLLEDLRFAARVLWKKPSLAILIVVTLALGIGAGSTMFGVIHTLLVRPVDLPELDRLAVIQETNSRGEYTEWVAPRELLDFEEQTRSFSSLSAYEWWEVALTGGGGDPEQLVGFRVSPGWFPTLGARPAAGRWFASDEVQGQNERVVVLSHKLWQRRYGGDPSVVGRDILLDGVSYTVVGAMPEGFALPPVAELWVPLALTPEQRADRATRTVGVIGRLAPDATLAHASAELAQIGERLAMLYPQTNARRSLRVVSLARSLSEDFTRDFLFMAFGAALFVLLIACANVANVFLAHAVSRRRELAVRAALGAGRARIVRQLLTEAVLLGLIAGGAALFVASWALELLKAAMPASIIRFIAGWNDMGVDGTVLGFAVLVGVTVGLVFGTIPALQVSRTDPGTILKEGERGAGGGRSAHRFRSALVVAQVALALVLLLAAGAIVQGFRRLADPGLRLDPHGVLVLKVALPDTRYPERHHVLDFQRRALDGLSALAGVEAAAVTNNVPWGTNGWSRIPHVEGRVDHRGELPSADFRTVSPGYLPLLRVALHDGRGLADADGRAAPPVAVISTAAAALYWPGESPLGKRLRFSAKDDTPWITVVGIVSDVEEYVGERGPRPAVYVPAEQATGHMMYLVARTGGDPTALARAAQGVVHAIDPLLPVTEARSLSETRRDRFAGLRLGSSIMAIFAVLALVLAVVGIYGVIANLVTQRTHEIGVRMALGARRGHVLGMVLRRGLVLAGAGVALGLAVGLTVMKLLASIFVGLARGEALLFGSLAAAVALAALLGCWIPARRATRVDPMVALRHE